MATNEINPARGKIALVAFLGFCLVAALATGIVMMQRHAGWALLTLVGGNGLIVLIYEVLAERAENDRSDS